MIVSVKSDLNRSNIIKSNQPYEYIKIFIVSSCMSYHCFDSENSFSFETVHLSFKFLYFSFIFSMQKYFLYMTRICIPEIDSCNKIAIEHPQRISATQSTKCPRFNTPYRQKGFAVGDLYISYITSTWSNPRMFVLAFPNYFCCVKCLEDVHIAKNATNH